MNEEFAKILIDEDNGIKIYYEDSYEFPTKNYSLPKMVGILKLNDILRILYRCTIKGEKDLIHRLGKEIIEDIHRTNPRVETLLTDKKVTKFWHQVKDEVENDIKKISALEFRSYYKYDNGRFIKIFDGSVIDSVMEYYPIVYLSFRVNKKVFFFKPYLELEIEGGEKSYPHISDILIKTAEEVEVFHGDLWGRDYGIKYDAKEVTPESISEVTRIIIEFVKNISGST